MKIKNHGGLAFIVEFEGGKQPLHLTKKELVELGEKINEITKDKVSVQFGPMPVPNASFGPLPDHSALAGAATHNPLAGKPFEWNEPAPPQDPIVGDLVFIDKKIMSIIKILEWDHDEAYSELAGEVAVLKQLKGKIACIETVNWFPMALGGEHRIYKIIPREAICYYASTHPESADPKDWMIRDKTGQVWDPSQLSPFSAGKPKDKPFESMDQCVFDPKLLESLYPEAPKYVMGADISNTDINSYCLALETKEAPYMKILLSKTAPSSREFREEIDNIAKYFNVSILKEENGIINHAPPKHAAKWAIKIKDPNCECIFLGPKDRPFARDSSECKIHND